MRTAQLSLICLLVLGLGACGQSDPSTDSVEVTPVVDKPAAEGEKLSYNRDIRPILSDKCFACHGPDQAAIKGKLRLDVIEDGKGYNGAYFAITPGDAEDSEVFYRIVSDDPDDVMPPPSAKIELTPEEKDKLIRWIEQGAEYEDHWSFVSLPDRIALPEVKNERWVRDPIDRFVLARLEAEGISPSKEATRQRWLRRVTYDLTGLPPTAQELKGFLNDQSDDAYEKVVDRLLASPHYGERMAVPWLDMARYADTNGFSVDDRRNTWPWRDWVIKSFNENLPYDQFLTWQVAGDLLPNATQEQVLATTFNRLHSVNAEGGALPEEWRNEGVADRL
ncbi:MAG: DUF1549 domain-containing protein, partial [Planctomycetota bacterium]